MTIAILNYIKYLSLFIFFLLLWLPLNFVFFWLFMEIIFEKNDRDANKVITKKVKDDIWWKIHLSLRRAPVLGRFTLSSFVRWWSESVLAVFITKVLPAGFAINNYVIVWVYDSPFFTHLTLCMQVQRNSFLWGC